MSFAKAQVKIVLAALIGVLCLATLAGCSDAANAEADAQTQNRQYMSSVNTIMETLNGNMDEFATAVKDGEVISLSSQLSAVDTCVSDLEALQAPEAMKDIHTSYVEGAKELQTALSDYVKLYEDVKAPAKGSYGYSDYDSRLTDIQKHYEAGLKALEEADSKAQAA